MLLTDFLSSSQKYQKYQLGEMIAGQETSIKVENERQIDLFLIFRTISPNPQFADSGVPFSVQNHGNRRNPI